MSGGRCTWPLRLAVPDGLGDELLGGGHFLSHVLLRNTCREARFQVVPKRLSREIGKV